MAKIARLYITVCSVMGWGMLKEASGLSSKAETEPEVIHSWRLSAACTLCFRFSLEGRCDRHRRGLHGCHSSCFASHVVLLHIQAQLLHSSYGPFFLRINLKRGRFMGQITVCTVAVGLGAETLLHYPFPSPPPS